MIKATGNKDGKRMAVIYDGKVFLFDGEKDEFYEEELVRMLKDEKIFAGTYIAERYDDPLNIIENLRNYFFDDVAEVESDEDVTFPYEKGVIY